MPVSSRLPSLGSRGEGWVAAQLVLIAGIVLAGWWHVGWPESVALPGRILGILLAAAGFAGAFIAFRALGRSMTMLPKPRAGGRLVEHGPYRLVRHPLYGAGLVVFLGYSLGRGSWLALALTGVLAVLWDLKASREEVWLEERYPGYAGYRRRTPRRLLPWLR
ncbi:MAG: isoprenylcysteine carboxylmethyltransferase family protein [Actinobacteria bacterium]|nr:isoprenylcysteine carboxylmethyltransferase family protein [Actinomycetota bacterium]